MVVDDAVHQQDRGPGGIEIVMDHAALLRAQSLEIVPRRAVAAVLDSDGVGQGPEGVEHQVGGRPARLDRDTAGGAGQVVRKRAGQIGDPAALHG